MLSMHEDPARWAGCDRIFWRPGAVWRRAVWRRAVWRRAVWRRAVWTGLALAATVASTGCGWQQNSLSEAQDATDDAPRMTPCSLEQVQARKTAARDPQIEGVATPFIIHAALPSATDRLVRGGDAIYFALPADGEAAATELRWSLEALDPGGRPLAAHDGLTDGSMIRLRSAATGPQSAAATAAPPGAAGSDVAPPLIIVKADVPDQTRPSTCDARVRDGDFVFVHTISPSVWLGATPAGDLNVPPGDRAPRAASGSGTGDPGCASDHESCETDRRGGLVCAWAPSCAK